MDSGTDVSLPTGYLYHGTRSNNLQSIAAGGLIPHVSELDEAANDARVYFGVNPAVTGIGLGMDDADLLMRVRGDALDDANIDEHIPSNLALFTRSGINPSDIEVQDSTGGWVPLIEFLRRLKG